MSKQILILKDGIKTTLEASQVENIVQQSEQIVVKLKNGEQIILSKTENFSIEILENNESIMRLDSSNLENLSELEKFLAQESNFWFDNKFITYGGGGLLTAGVAAVASSGGGNSTSGDVTPPTILTQELAADNKTVTGATEAGATVTVSYNGKVVGTALADAEGKYSITLDKAYSNGEKLEVVATDTANNSTKPNAVTAPDTTAPSSLTQVISADGQTITGKTEAGATVTATFNGQVVGTAIAGTDGQYTLTLTPAFTNGEKLEVIATDKANNSTKPNTITAPDTTAPATLTQELAADNKTVTGATEAGATVTVSYNGKVVGTALADAEGKYSVTLNKAYKNGEKLEVVATDTANNSTKPNAVTAPDTTAPSSLTQVISADGQTITGKTEAGATVAATFNGQVVGTAIAGTDGQYTLTLTPAFTNGEKLEVIATDKANNSTKPNTITAPDTTAPATLTQELAADNKTVTGTTEAGATVTVSYNGKVVGTALADAEGKYSITLDKAYSNGEKLEVVATDTANNSTKPNAVTAPDTTAPSSLTQVISADGQTITGKTEAGATVTATFNGQVVGTAIAGTDGQYTLTLTPAFTNGEKLEVIATDKANNSTKPNTITAPDTTAPATLTQELAADNKTVTGTTEAGATVTVSYNGKVVGTALADAEGKYSITLDKAYSNGEKLEVVAKDQAGNALTNKLYAPVDHLENAAAHFELAEIFETQTVLKDDIVYSQQDQSSMYVYVDFEVTGENASIILSLTTASGSINGSYNYSIYGDGISSSGSKSISSIGLSYQDIILAEGLAPGHYTLQLDAYSWNTDFELVVKQEKLVNELVFDGYETVVGHIFADVNGKVSAPQSYILKVGDQEIRVENGKGNVASITYQTEHGTFTLKANGSYTYQSNWFESGLDAKGLNDQLNIQISSMDGQTQSDYQVYITTDVTPPVAGELIFTDFEDSGISAIDGITNDASFDLSIRGNELSSTVEYQYSTDGGVTWFKLEHQFDYWGDGFNFFDEGTYSFRAKVTDFVGNESYTNTKTITVDWTAPELQSVFSYDAQNDQVIFNAPTNAYEVYKWVNDQWQAVKLNNTVGWESAKYKVIATDVAGNIAEKIYNIGEVSGTYKPLSSVEINVIQGTAENDYLYGGDGDDVLIANGGSDTLEGENGDDTLIVQSGYYSSMYLRGGYGTDTYIIDKQFLTSSVTIAEYRIENDILRLKGYVPEELLLGVDNQSLTINFTDSPGSIHIYNQFENNTGISFIEFDDGTVWDREAILANTKGRLLGTEADDELIADQDISVVYGLDGNDRIIGGVQNDYLYGGDGDDILIANGGSDTLEGENGDDTLIVQSGYYSSMYLRGGYGTDTYIIDKQFLTSSVTIAEYRIENDILRLKGYVPEELLLGVDNQSLTINFTDSPGSIHIYNQFENNTGISFIEFDDGTVWDREAILANTKGRLLGTEADDELIADQDISVVYGLDGNDRIIGGVQNDYLYGGDGDDILIANGGSDTLEGENGDDTLIVQSGYYSSMYLRGGYGTDTYIIDKQFLTSSVTIAEYRIENDILRLKGYVPEELLLGVDNQSLTINFTDSPGSIHIYNQFENNTGISFIEFDDGTVWDRETILNKVNALQPTLFSIGEESLLDVLSIEDTELFDHSADGMLLAENSVASLLVESTDIEVDLTQFVEDAMAITTSTSSIATSTLVSNYRVDVYDDLLMPNTMSI